MAAAPLTAPVTKLPNSCQDWLYTVLKNQSKWRRRIEEDRTNHLIIIPSSSQIREDFPTKAYSGNGKLNSQKKRRRTPTLINMNWWLDNQKQTIKTFSLSQVSFYWPTHLKNKHSQIEPNWPTLWVLIQSSTHLADWLWFYCWAGQPTGNCTVFGSYIWVLI